MSNLLAEAINCDDAVPRRDVVGYCFPTEWPADREQRARYIGEWLKTEARYLGS
jgi:hypothetical protein